MATFDQRTVDALLTTHTPLVGHAVAQLASRLPATASLEPLIAAGLEGLRKAAHSYKENRDDSFARCAKPHIAAAIADAVGGQGHATGVSSDTEAGGLMASIASDLGADVLEFAALLPSAHPAAFATVPERPRRPAGHYAAVAAASEYRSHLAGAEAGVTEPATLRRFGT